MFVKSGNSKSNLRLKGSSNQTGDAAPGKEPGSGDVAGTVSDSEQVDRMAAQVGQSARREGVVSRGSGPGSSQIPRSVRLRVHGPLVPKGRQDSHLE